MKFVDTDGQAPTDIIVLNNPKGAGGFGHMGVLIGNDKSGWTFVSKEGRNKEPWYSNEVTGGPALSPLTKSYGSLADFRADQASDKNLGGYTEEVRFKTTEAQDKEALATVTESAESWYNVACANCADAVSDGLKAVGLDPGYTETRGNGYVQSGGQTTKSLDPRPNVRFSEVKSNNKAKTVPTTTSTTTTPVTPKPVIDAKKPETHR